jgi:hypothetical protein
VLEAAVGEWMTITWVGSRHKERQADEAGVHLGEPKWPAAKELTRAKLLQRGYQDNFIADMSHPIAKVYTGRARR